MTLLKFVKKNLFTSKNCSFFSIQKNIFDYLTNFSIAIILSDTYFVYKYSYILFTGTTLHAKSFFFDEKKENILASFYPGEKSRLPLETLVS